MRRFLTCGTIHTIICGSRYRRPGRNQRFEVSSEAIARHERSIGTKENNMNRLLLGLAGITAAGLWLLTGPNLHSAPQGPASAPKYLEGDAYQKARAFSPAVITRGGRIIWLAGQTATQDLNGKSLQGDFQGQARTVFALMDRTLKRDGASLKNLV